MLKLLHYSKGAKRGPIDSIYPIRNELRNSSIPLRWWLFQKAIRNQSVPLHTPGDVELCLQDLWDQPRHTLIATWPLGIVPWHKSAGLGLPPEPVGTDPWRFGGFKSGL